ncbi:MAG: hypothetical protein J6B50_02100 [Lachnospiraceae bacterium]|nr:hypothetical protein [Lachnospiraceae bacterium]
MKRILKKLTVAIALTGLMLCMTACGKKDVVKDDLYTYLTEMSSVQELQKTAINEYNSYVSATDADSQQLLDALNNSIIPTYEDYITKINAITPETVEVQALQTTCGDAAKKQLEALQKVAEAIEACDSDMLNDADKLITEAEAAFDDYEGQIEALASEHEITLVQESSDTGAVSDTSEDTVSE